MEEPLAMDLMPLNLKRETVCDAGVGGTAGAASTSWSGRGERKMELRNMVMVGVWSRQVVVVRSGILISDALCRPDTSLSMFGEIQ
jgi:hypothetical protein